MYLRYTGWVWGGFFIHFLAMYLQCPSPVHHPLPPVSSDEVVVPEVGGPIIMRLRDGMLGERLRTMGELEVDSDVDVVLGEMMPADFQITPLVEIQDFAAEEEEQARHDRGRADEEANALADRLVREGRALIPYEEDGGDDALPDAEYNTPPEYSQ